MLLASWTQDGCSAPDITSKFQEGIKRRFSSCSLVKVAHTSEIDWSIMTSLSCLMVGLAVSMSDKGNSTMYVSSSNRLTWAFTHGGGCSLSRDMQALFKPLHLIHQHFIGQRESQIPCGEGMDAVMRRIQNHFCNWDTTLKKFTL